MTGTYIHYFMSRTVANNELKPRLCLVDIDRNNALPVWNYPRDLLSGSDLFFVFVFRCCCCCLFLLLAPEHDTGVCETQNSSKSDEISLVEIFLFKPQFKLLEACGCYFLSNFLFHLKALFILEIFKFF